MGQGEGGETYGFKLTEPARRFKGKTEKRQRMHVFISSTCYDLVDLRAELETFFGEAGVAVRMSDRSTSEFEVLPDRNSIETCLANVRDCDEFIIVLSHRYGPSLAKAGYPDVSATHLEYREALSTEKPIRMYVRDRLEADYCVWKMNHRRTDMELTWCKEPHDRGLLHLLDEHSKLVADAPRSNWVTLFRDSVDLKTQLTRVFRAAFARATVDALTKSGRIPFLEVTAQFRSHDNRLIEIELTVRNLGNAMAVSPMFTFEPDAFTQKMPSLAPQESAACSTKWGNLPGVNLSLLPRLAYSTIEGHKFVDQGKLTATYPVNRGDKRPTVNYELSERKYDGFSEKLLLKAD